jgi:hypothetical protein
VHCSYEYIVEKLKIRNSQEGVNFCQFLCPWFRESQINADSGPKADPDPEQKHYLKASFWIRIPYVFGLHPDMLVTSTGTDLDLDHSLFS